MKVGKWRNKKTNGLSLTHLTEHGDQAICGFRVQSGEFIEQQPGETDEVCHRCVELSGRAPVITGRRKR